MFSPPQNHSNHEKVNHHHNLQTQRRDKSGINHLTSNTSSLDLKSSTSTHFTDPEASSLLVIKGSPEMESNTQWQGNQNAHHQEHNHKKS